MPIDPNPLVERARELARAAGADPDAPIPDEPDDVEPPPPPTLGDLAVDEARAALDDRHVPVRAGATRGEIDAAIKAAGAAGSARRMALAAFRHAGPRGLTDYELADTLGAIPNRIATRRKELVDAGLVTAIAAKRETPAGIRAQVHAITDLGLEVSARPATPA